MEENRFKESCILETAGKIQKARIYCESHKVPEWVQDTYEDVIDKLIAMLGATEKQRDLFWSIADPS
jgi:hypothetical protein